MSEFAEPSAWEQVKAEAMKEPHDETVNLVEWIEAHPDAIANLLYKIEYFEEEKRGGTVTEFLDDLRNQEKI